MRNVALTLALISWTTLAGGCGDDDDTPPGMDGGRDAGSDGGGADAPVTDGGETDAGPRDLTIPGLEAPVEAIQDDRGMWHVYAASVADAFRAEGYLMARDRWGQMDMMRRSVTGRTAEFAGALIGCREGESCSAFEDDVAARFEGNARNATVLWDALSTEEQGLLEAFTAGVNVHVDELRTGLARPPRGVGAAFAAFMIEPEDWTALDTLAIARYQSAALSFEMSEDLSMTSAVAAWEAAFDPASADSRLVARAGAFHDIFPFRPARDVFTRAGFPNVGTDGGTRALRPLRRAQPRLPLASSLPSRGVLEAGRLAADRIEERFQRLFGDETRGSNSWVVHGSVTASGNPILANDPHLQLSSPPLFWMVHLNTKRAGGDWNVAGLALAGTPVVLLGYNDDVAWGLTTHNFDVTDVYRETITPGTGGAPDTVLFGGAQVPIETVTETIRVKVIRELSGGGREIAIEERTVDFERVPHHGLLVPNALADGARTPTEGLSVKWTGNQATREVWAFYELATATSVEDARDAYESFGVGGQNLVVVDADDIFWTTQVILPVRDPRALTYDPATRTGFAPCFVLPGQGDHEWTGTLSDRYLPHDLNPAAGYIATANNDGVGTNADGNPFDDDHYIGWSMDPGHRIARIRERLDALAARGAITPEEMSALQGDSLSPLGRLTRDAIVAELDRALAEAVTPGTHADLTTLVAGLDAATVTTLQAARDRLAAWTFETPGGVEDAPTAAEIADSVAASIFNAASGRITRALLDDELDALAAAAGRGFGARDSVVVWALTDPSSLASYDATLGDTVLWDDLATAAVTETRGMVVVQAVVDALAWLAAPEDATACPDDPRACGAGLGTAMDGWRWGYLHTLRLATLVPQIGGDVLSIPAAADWVVPGGWPRHGDRHVVDASNFNQRATTRFGYGSGPQQRLVVEMTATGPRVWNALPGGEAIDPDSPHHADEAELWRRNQAPEVWLTDAAVEAHAETRLRFVVP